MELPELHIQDKQLKAQIIKYLEPLNIDSSKCERLLKAFNQEIDKGRARATVTFY